MHDPNRLAFEIYLGRKKKKDGTYRSAFIEIWVKDPCTDGTDDSQAWFMRARHGDKKILKEIKSELDFEFDRVFKSDGTTYHTGYFSPNSGQPNWSTMGITLDMFTKAAWVFFGRDRKKHKKWMKDNLYDILHFAENGTDSLRDDIEGIFRIGTGTEWNREEALNSYASIIYGWLLRSNRKWYKHPKWQIRRWRIKVVPFFLLKRRYWDKCSKCGKRGFKHGAMSDWNGTKIWHQECDGSEHKPSQK